MVCFRQRLAIANENSLVQLEKSLLEAQTQKRLAQNQMLRAIVLCE